MLEVVRLKEGVELCRGDGGEREERKRKREREGREREGG